MKIIWTDNAHHDLQGIKQYLLKQADASIMRSEAERIACAVLRLAQFPSSGRPGRVPDTREVVVPPYVIPYRIRGDVVQVLNVFHTSMNL